MQVLLAHNFYRSASPSGENEVFEIEKTLLRARGHSVVEFTARSDDLSHGFRGLAQGALSSIWSRASRRALESECEIGSPDLIHVHNVFPMLSPSIFWARRSCPVVLTLHNYRLHCANGVPMRPSGNVCTECMDRRSSWPAIRHGCYRGSRLATTPLAFGISLHRAIGTWVDRVDAFIALSEFQRDLMVSAGLPSRKVHVRPNFFPGDAPVPVPWPLRGGVVFVGRLSAEKGILDVLEAWRSWGADSPRLTVVGDGPLMSRVRELAAGANVEVAGRLNAAEAQERIASAKLLIAPSRWFECFPLTIREALAFGTPVVTSDLGPLPHIVREGVSGVITPAGDPVRLLAAVRRVWGDDALLQRLGAGAFSDYLTRFAENSAYESLMLIYREAGLSFSVSGGNA